MLMGLVFIIEVVEGGNLVGGFEAISLSELKNYPEIEKGLEKGMDEYNANLRKEVPQVTKRYTDCYSTIFFVHFYLCVLCVCVCVCVCMCVIQYFQ